MAFNARMEDIQTTFKSTKTVDQQDFDWLIRLIAAQDRVITTSDAAVEAARRYISDLEQESEDMKVLIFQKDMEIHELSQKLTETDTK